MLFFSETRYRYGSCFLPRFRIPRHPPTKVFRRLFRTGLLSYPSLFLAYWELVVWKAGKGKLLASLGKFPHMQPASQPTSMETAPPPTLGRQAGFSWALVTDCSPNLLPFAPRGVNVRSLSRQAFPSPPSRALRAPSPPNPPTPPNARFG